MLSIDEAIAREREMARIFETKDFAEYSKRLAEWLEELKRRREYDGEIIGSGALNNAYNQGYNKAIDDFLREIKIDVIATTFGLRICDAERIAQQLKAGGENDNFRR